MSDPLLSDPVHPTPPLDRPEKAGVKVPHLVFGLLFLGLVVIWALGASGVLRGGWLTILGPAVLVAAGLIGLVASLAGARNRNRNAHALSQPVSQPVSQPLPPTVGEETPDSGYAEDIDHQHDDTEEIR